MRPVATPGELSRFIELPYRLHAGDPNWIAPLRSEPRKEFAAKTNPFLTHTTWQLFLLERGGATVGRIAAFIDHNAVEHWGEKIGHFGYFECPDDETAATLLFDAARAWLAGQGMARMRGPWTFVSQEWGLVVEGFSPPPCVMAPYNPPYHRQLLERQGLEQVKDLLVFEIDAAKGYRIPERVLTQTDRVRKRNGISIRHIDMARYDDEVALIFSLANSSLTGNWGYVPLTQEEVLAVARDLKPIANPRGVVFAETDGGTPVGFAIAIPDINVALKGLDGRLFPFGWLKLLLRMRKLDAWRMFALGLAPGFQGRGIDALIYRALYESIWTPKMRMEINYVLDDNWPMLNAIAKLDATPMRRYRVYEASI